MRDLLFLPHRIPYPPNKGDKIRAYHVLRYLQRHFRVHLGTFIDCAEDLRYAEHLAAGCASSCFIRTHPRWARLSSLRGLVTDEPLSLPYFRSARLQRWVNRTLDTHAIGTGLAFSGPMAQYLPAESEHGPLMRVMDLVDVDSEKWQSYAEGKAWPLSMLYRREGTQLLEYERLVAKGFDQVMLVSRAEAALFRLRAPESGHKIDHFNNGVDSEYFSPQHKLASPYPHARVVALTGAMDYAPNIEAAIWFAERVMPSLRLRFPDLQFHIVGSRPAHSLLALRRLPGVFVSGTVDDIRPYLRHAAVIVAPLHIGRGVQNKVLEAMAMQKTVVATPQALEGICAAVGTEVLRAADAGEFIYHVGQELASPSDIGVAARRRILRDYRWDATLRRLGAALGVQDTDLTDPADLAEPALRLESKHGRAARDAGGVAEKAL
jgi:sugar transferase (PEP-CTERM/EpsH1 system associated)